MDDDVPFDVYNLKLFTKIE